MSTLGDVVRKLMELKRITEGSMGQSPQPLENLLYVFLEKIAILMPLDHISHVFRAI